MSVKGLRKMKAIYSHYMSAWTKIFLSRSAAGNNQMGREQLQETIT